MNRNGTPHSNLSCESPGLESRQILSNKVNLGKILTPLHTIDTTSQLDRGLQEILCFATASPPYFLTARNGRLCPPMPCLLTIRTAPTLPDASEGHLL